MAKNLPSLDARDRARSLTSPHYEHLTGPFDIVGDIHGCLDELYALLKLLGYDIWSDGSVRHPERRTVVCVGDFVDRGPDSAGVLRLAMASANEGSLLCVPGNHDDKLARKLSGKKVQVSQPLAATLQEIEAVSPDFGEDVREFIATLPAHLILDGGMLVVAHAGLKEALHGREDAETRSFCLFGDVTGEVDEFGYPVRLPWGESYRGEAMVVYGHTPISELVWVNNTINIDTGCVFGGQLTALRYPERTFVQVPACKTYFPSKRPF